MPTKRNLKKKTAVVKETLPVQLNITGVTLETRNRFSMMAGSRGMTHAALIDSMIHLISDAQGLSERSKEVRNLLKEHNLDPKLV